MVSCAILLRVTEQIRCFSHLAITQPAPWLSSQKVTATEVGVID